MVPGIGATLGTVMTVRDMAKDARVRAALERLRLQKPAPVKKRTGTGAYVALGAGLVAAAGVGYAVWQTFRADDELWVADDDTQASVKAQED
jgi:cytochrome c-type biogenesis protein CcmH/NrfG